MARIRTIKPDFAFDESLSKLNPRTRLFFILLWTHSDRAGRGEDMPGKLRALIFPYEPKIDCEAIMRELHPEWVIRYEVNGRRFFQIRTWEKHQRPHIREPQSEIPEPDKAVLRQCLGSAKAVPRPLDKGEGKGREGNGERRPQACEEFEAFWAAYPRKAGKVAAAKAWKKLNPSCELIHKIGDGLEASKREWSERNTEEQYIAHASTWLNQRRWEDKAGLDTNRPKPVNEIPMCPDCLTRPARHHDGSPKDLCDECFASYTDRPIPMARIKGVGYKKFGTRDDQLNKLEAHNGF